MTITELQHKITQNKNFLCVGLDSDPEKIPAHLRDADDPVFEFNRQIIDATREYCVAYKINTAFYEALGSRGWETMRKTAFYIGTSHYIIADAKRGDIGNTCDMYAKAFFGDMNFDAITLAPYMGSDSVTPFLKYEGKSVIILGLTSNASATELETLEMADGKKLYQQVMTTAATWSTEERMMFVVGATRPEYLSEIRKEFPRHFFLVPGVGAQGGSLDEVCKAGFIPGAGLLVNASRQVIYASADVNFAEAAAREAQKLAAAMVPYFS